MVAFVRYFFPSNVKNNASGANVFPLKILSYGIFLCENTHDADFCISTLYSWVLPM